jgi:thermostable 8-oxoguanine DNA glycosylase
MIIDPSNPTNFNSTKSELEIQILFWILAAGKTGIGAAKVLTNLLGSTQSPFQHIINNKSTLRDDLRRLGMGCHDIKSRGMISIAESGLDLQRCSVDDLESHPGISLKTSRCFMLHTRRGARYAGLDTHLRKFLRAAGIEVPDGQLSRSKYLRYEHAFLIICDSMGRDPYSLDIEIWRAYSSKNEAAARQIVEEYYSRYPTST